MPDWRQRSGLTVGARPNSFRPVFQATGRALGALEARGVLWSLLELQGAPS